MDDEDEIGGFDREFPLVIDRAFISVRSCWRLAMAESGAFSNASIRGAYALTSLAEGGRVPSASIGMLRFDGQGHISGQIITNMPGPTYQERQVQEGSVEGTFTVDEIGLGFGRTEILYRYGDGMESERSPIWWSLVRR